MIREDLLEFQYYLDRLSKFMQESFGINEQVRTFHSLLVQVDDFYNKFFRDISIFDSYYIGPNRNILLDKLGSIFGCQRHFTIPEYDPARWNVIIGFLDIDLEDEDFLVYIKAQIIKQNFNGTREELQTLYTTYEDGKLKKGILDLIFYYLQSPTETSAECYIYWSMDKEYSQNLQNLFLNGYLTIESMGILYHRSTADIGNFLTFAKYMEENQYQPTPPFTPVNPKEFNCFAYNGYNLLHDKPDDWDENYQDYADIQATQLSEGDPHGWEDDDYYESRLDGSYVKLTNEPSNWEDIYTNYYTLSITSAPSTWAADTYFEHLEYGGEFA